MSAADADKYLVSPPTPKSPRKDDSRSETDVSPLPPPEPVRNEGGAATDSVGSPPGLSPLDEHTDREEKVDKPEDSTVATSSRAGSKHDSGKMDVQEFPKVHDMFGTGTHSASSTPAAASASRGSRPAAARLAAAATEAAADFVEQEQDEAGTVTSSKRRQVSLRFAFTWKHVTEGIRLEDGDVNVKHKVITDELEKHLLTLGIERKIRRRNFLGQEPRTSQRSGKVHQHGRVVTWEVVCSLQHSKEISRKLTDSSRKFRLYGAPMTLVSDHSETDSGSDTTSSSTGSYYSDSPSANAREDLSVADRQEDSPSKRPKIRNSDF